VSKTVWRIATDTPDYSADDLSGAGAKKSGGRWNRVDTPLVYCSESIALACLETVVHLNSGGLPLNRYLVRIDIPDAQWQAAELFPGERFVGWDAQPPGMVSLDFGTDWVSGKRSALLLVPSSIVPEECNILLNPLHEDAARIKAAKVRKWLYDPRIQAGKT
jgi:RES domain-containing protein